MAEQEHGGTGGEHFLARWSRLKRASRGEARAAERPAEPSPAGAEATPTPAQAAPLEEQEIDLELLPKLEEITAETDLSLFFRKGVPAALRNAALRRAWSVDPTIRDFIGPADYAWDWNTPGGVPDFLDGVGETPSIRALVERMLAPRRESETRDGVAAEGPDGAATAAPPAVAEASSVEGRVTAGSAAPAAQEGWPPGPGVEAGQVMPGGEHQLGTMALPAAVPGSGLPPPSAADGGESGGLPSPTRRRRHGGALPG